MVSYLFRQLEQRLISAGKHLILSYDVTTIAFLLGPVAAYNPTLIRLGAKHIAGNQVFGWMR